MSPLDKGTDNSRVNIFEKKCQTINYQFYGCTMELLYNRRLNRDSVWAAMYFTLFENRKLCDNVLFLSIENGKGKLFCNQRMKQNRIVEK